MTDPRRNRKPRPAGASPRRRPRPPLPFGRLFVSVVFVVAVKIDATAASASSSCLPSSARASFVPPPAAASSSSASASSPPFSSSPPPPLRVVPLKTDAPPYRPRYRPQRDDPLPPPGRRPGKLEDDEYYTSNVPPAAAGAVGPTPGFLASGGSAGGYGQRVTLTRFLSDAVQDRPELRDIESLLLSVQMACKTISHLVDRAGINQLSAPGMMAERGAASSDPLEQYDFRLNSMKRLDQLSTNVLRNALRFTGKLQMVAPARDGRPLPGEEELAERDGEDVAEVMDEYGPAAHQPGVLIAKALDGKYVACFDPLDGSGNADAAICTGTVFGVFETPEEPEDDDDGGGDGDGDASASDKSEKKKKSEKRGVGKDVEQSELVRSVLQPGRNLRAAGYCLYSSATILVLTTGSGTHGFTLDPQINEFVLTHPDIRIPPRGNVYSCNEANSEGWDDDLRRYLRALKTGEGRTGTRYALRYVGSMVGDIHRTLMYGGIFCYPSDRDVHPRGNLQLLYKSAPMAYVVEQAGGRSSDGRRELLDVVPRRVHQRSPCFIGSPEDVEEMKTFIPHEE